MVLTNDKLKEGIMDLREFRLETRSQLDKMKTSHKNNHSDISDKLKKVKTLFTKEIKNIHQSQEENSYKSMIQAKVKDGMPVGTDDKKVRELD